MSETFFITGARGCIGAWVVKRLLERGDHPVVFDLSQEAGRLLQVLDPEDLDRVTFEQGDVTDGSAVRAALERSGAQRVVHLAGLQVPSCKANPVLGAQVNVVGTLNVFQAAADLGLRRVAYASSAAVYGAEDGAVDESVRPAPTTHYGVFKQANEGNAGIYFQDRGLSSAGLRPLTVYGVGRDQGLTSGPTKAMKAAIISRNFCVPFSGATDFLYVSDAADAFLAAAEGGPEGAEVYNLHGQSVAVEDVLRRVESQLGSGETARLTCTGSALPIAAELDAGAFAEAYPSAQRTPLEQGIALTMERFRQLRDAGRLELTDLDQ